MTLQCEFAAGWPTGGTRTRRYLQVSGRCGASRTEGRAFDVTKPFSASSTANMHWDQAADPSQPLSKKQQSRYRPAAATTLPAAPLESRKLRDDERRNQRVHGRRQNGGDVLHKPQLPGLAHGRRPAWANPAACGRRSNGPRLLAAAKALHWPPKPRVSVSPRGRGRGLTSASGRVSHGGLERGYGPRERPNHVTRQIVQPRLRGGHASTRRGGAGPGRLRSCQ